MTDQLQSVQKSLAVAKPQVDAAGVIKSDQAFVETLHGPGDGHTGAYGVHAQVVADSGGPNDGVGVVHTAQRP